MSEFEPITLARIPVNSRDEVRATVLEWEGRRSLDIRTWSLSRSSGEHRPTPRGARIAIEQVPELLAALQTAINCPVTVKTGADVLDKAYNPPT